MGAHLKNLQAAFGKVFVNASYIALAGALAVLVFLFAVWLPNIGLMTDIFATSSAPLSTKVKLAWSLLDGIRTNFSFLSAGYTIAVAILFGLNSAMAAYVLKHQRALFTKQEKAVGFGGLASGAFGIGCAACGSFLLSAALSFFGAAGALALLPLRGGEFGILSVVLLLISLQLTAKKIAAPFICKPNTNIR